MPGLIDRLSTRMWMGPFQLGMRMNRILLPLNGLRSDFQERMDVFLPFWILIIEFRSGNGVV